MKQEGGQPREYAYREAAERKQSWPRQPPKPPLALAVPPRASLLLHGQRLHPSLGNKGRGHLFCSKSPLMRPWNCQLHWTLCACVRVYTCLMSQFLKTEVQEINSFSKQQKLSDGPPTLLGDGRNRGALANSGNCVGKLSAERAG